MATLNDHLYDHFSICGITISLPRWKDDRIVMMQAIIAILIGTTALIYVIRKFSAQFTKTEDNPKCKGCPVPDIRNNKK